MHGDTLRQVVRISSPSGLHLRPLTAFAQRAQQFQARIAVTKEDRSVDGKSPFEMFLMVSPPGVELTIEATGPDAQAALDALTALLQEMTAEDNGQPNDSSK
ncbi:MAG TPA: HPr family phosphocarrier protein [Gemmataceae bacterium]|nr:HPr family phosphocarrier protein [Gemmataceae bacterium]